MTLKGRLLAAHELTTFQRIEMLHEKELFGGRKLLEMISHMLVARRRMSYFSSSSCSVFRGSWMVLIGDNFSDLRDLVAEGDYVWAMHIHEHGAVVSVQAEEWVPVPVATIHLGGQSQWSNGGWGSSQWH
jgi:hypothetical protein